MMSVLPEDILLCIVAPLLAVLPFARGARRGFVACVFVGMVTCLASGYVSGLVCLLTNVSTEHIAVYLSPMIEEAAKLLPVLFVLLAYEPNERDLMEHAAAIGAGFATFENCCFLITSSSERALHLLVRGLAVGVLHVGSISILALGLGFAYRHRLLGLPTAVGILSLSQTLHALYNLLVSVPGVPRNLGYALPLCVMALLVALHRTIVVHNKPVQGDHSQK